MMMKIIQLVHFPSLMKAKEEPLKSNLKELKLKSDSLFDKRDAINKNLVRELKKGKMPTRECHTWLKKVVEIEQHVYDLLESEKKDSELEVPDLRARLVMVLDEIAEYLEKSPNKNGTALDDAVNGRSKRMKASKIGGYNENQTRKIRGNAVISSAANGESSNTEGKSDILSSKIKEMLNNNSNKRKNFETKRSIKNQQGYTKPESKISVKKEAKAVKALDVEAGKTPTKPDVQEAKQAMTSTPLILEEKSVIVSSEMKEVLPRNEMKNFQTESKSGNEKANHMNLPNLAVNFKRVIQFITPLVVPRSATRNEAVLGAAELPSTSICDINLPEAEAGNTIRFTVQKIIELMQDDKYRTIGIYGKGGIGKTTVLKALVCCPEIKDKFDFLIQVTVSRYWSRKKIQLELSRQIGLSVEGLHSEVEVASKLFHALQSKKFLLLLDDVWEIINLEKVGIPYPSPESHSRIIVTTRLVHICKIMAPDGQIEVASLSWKEAWNLFQEQVGGTISSTPIRPHAEVIVSECGGSPMMIRVIGRSLAKENDILVWRFVLSKLLSVTELKSAGTEDYNEAVLEKLKVGFDRLQDHDLKCSFLYCALFPEDHKIEISQLIKCWIQEGLITGSSADALEKGHKIVKHLCEASLVECVDGVSIKMPNMMRDLASWIMISEENSYDFLVGKKFNKDGNPERTLEQKITSMADSPPKMTWSSLGNHLLLPRAGASLLKPPEDKEWEETEMIFLMDNGISMLPEKPNCPKLKRLFLQRNTRLTSIPESFFDSMPCLQVLNLSKTNIRSLPPSVFRLTRLQALILRHCQCLSEIPPEIGKLESIEILDINGTEIYSLPVTIGRLSLLKHLHVSFHGYFDDNKFHKKPKNLIPGGVISDLQALEELSIGVQPMDTRWDTDVEFLAEEFCTLNKLNTLFICFPEVKYLKTFISSSRSWKADSLCKFKFVIGHDIKSSASRVPKNTEFDYNQEDRCLRYVNSEVEIIPQEIKEVLKRATAFYLDHQSMLSSLTEIVTDTSRQLKLCIVSECPKMVSILDGGLVNDERALPNLVHLSLHYLWNLKNIWNGQIPVGSFNALKVLSVHTCPRLEFVLSWSMLPFLASLEDLIVEDCASVTDIIRSEMKIELGGDADELPKLKKLELQYLPQLVRICNGSYQKIEHIRIGYCPKLVLNLPTCNE
ncbi:hypothetical protein ACH5RR_032221 [Cinchona calisaya]|uniref:AAA+ ATPase domain-containing protein n=1 Tax=Cinchona calisaya TaxID=153742 RepID=A0ABD2YK46_9GENT